MMFSTGQESPTSQYLEPNNQIDKMQHELLRLSTFNYFPANLSVSATQLSRAGFYYIGEQDIVQCFSCHLRVKDWSPDSDPVAVHMQYSYGQCPYLNSEFGKRLCGSHLRFSSFDIGMHRDTNKKQLSKNDIISLKSQNLNGEKMNYSRYAEGVTCPLSTSQDYYNSEFGSDEIVTSACSPSPQLGAESTSYNNDVYSNEQAHNKTSYNIENVYINTNNTEKPAHPKYSSIESRHTSFLMISTKNTAEAFAEAGFFYSGETDVVKCYFCGFEIHSWKNRVNFWVEHAMNSPSCGYLLNNQDISKAAGSDKVTSSTATSSISKKIVKETQTKTYVEGKKHAISKRRVNTYLSASLAKSVMDMGYSRDVVKQAIIQRFEQLGDHFFPNIESLVDAIVNIEENHLKSENGIETSSDSYNIVVKDLPVVHNQQTDAMTISEKKKRKKKKKKSKKQADGAENESKPKLNAIEEPANSSSSNSDNEQSASNTLFKQSAEELSVTIEQLKEERTCKVCMDEEANTVFLRCGHMVCCSKCTQSLKKCPICRLKIKGEAIRAFIS